MKAFKKAGGAAVSLMLASAVGLAGCSDGASKPPEESPARNEATPTSAPKEKVEITFWHVWSDKDAGPITARVEAFNKSQDRITVKVLGNQDATKQLTAISGGNPPDIALTYWNNIGPWGQAGAVLPLTDYLKNGKVDTASFVPAALERMKVNGEYYALPFTFSMASTLMYNKKAFQDAGITKPPETLEELFETAKKLTKRENGEITQIGFIPDYPWIDNVFWPIIFGGSWVDANGKLTANQEANVASIAYQRKFYEEFGMDQIAKFRSGMGQRGTPNDPLLTGKLAMMIGWEYNFPEERKPDGPIGIAPFPHPANRPDLKGSGMVSPRAVFIPKKAKHPDEAWEFMQYLVGHESQVEFSVESKTIPSLLPALDDPKLRGNEKLVMMHDFYERAKSKTLQGFPNSVYINEYLQALTEETEKALKGQATPQEAMDRVVARIQPLADKAASKS
ncbi:extracellular solute-binding protein [Paenibacillus thermoaerophilus]|nr:ABC transporter substrate-binding protein [Paenibacillus thermoaerophilus]